MGGGPAAGRCAHRGWLPLPRSQVPGGCSGVMLLRESAWERSVAAMMLKHTAATPALNHPACPHTPPPLTHYLCLPACGARVWPCSCRPGWRGRPWPSARSQWSVAACCCGGTGGPGRQKRLRRRVGWPRPAAAPRAVQCTRCPHCEAPTENAYHFLFECPFYAAQRTQHPLLFPATCTSLTTQHHCHSRLPIFMLPIPPLHPHRPTSVSHHPPRVS